MLDRSSLPRILDEKLRKSKSVICSLARSSERWWQINGSTTWMPQDNPFVDVKRKLQEEEKGKAATYKKWMAANDNRPCLYFADYDEMLRWMETNIGVASEYETEDRVKKQRYIACFIEADGNITMSPRIAQWIRDPHNPYYDSAEAAKHAIEVIAKGYAPKATLRYIVERGMLPDARLNSIHGEEHGRQLAQNNIGFLARFFQEWDADPQCFCG
jgi:hypothetical protein